MGSREGLPPGTVMADPEAHPTVMRAIGYSADELVEVTLDGPEGIPALRGRFTVLWVDVCGLGDPAVLQAVADQFQIHPLALEDVAHLVQRPKFEPYDEQLFICTRMPRPETQDTEQFSLFLGEGFVITFQEQPRDPFDGIRQRIRQGRQRIRLSGGDYLAYTLLDALVDSYFPLIDRCAAQLQDFEMQVVEHTEPHVVRSLHMVRRELLALLRIFRPMREVISDFARDDSGLVSDDTSVFLRDCHDHLMLLVDAAEAQREVGSSLLEVHLSMVSHRMNEVMKVLTITSTLFIPLTFIAGVYGMNFEVMPETREAWGYPAALGLMAAVAVGMLLFFRRKGWLGGPEAAAIEADANGSDDQLAGPMA